MRLGRAGILSALVLCAVALLVSWGRASPRDPFLLKIMERNTLRVGMDPTYPPFDTLNNRQPAGYDADLARALAADLGVRLEIKTYALDTLYDSLESGQTDLLISALPFIPERQAAVHYSAPYYQAGQVIVVRQGEKRIAAKADLAGKRVGVELGSEGDTDARRLVRGEIPTMQLLSGYSSPGSAFSALISNALDAVITDNASAQSYLRGHMGTVAILSPALTNEPYVIAMPARATQLSARIDATLARLRASGDLPRLLGEAP